MDKPKKLILDYSKWRCGEDGPNKLGEGGTALLNTEGFCCCLGLWSLQLGANEDELLGRGEPSELKTLISLFASEDEDDEVFGKSTTDLASDCIFINDETDTSPEEKIEQLRYKLEEEGIELEVINKP